MDYPLDGFAVKIRCSEYTMENLGEPNRGAWSIVQSLNATHKCLWYSSTINVGMNRRNEKYVWRGWLPLAIKAVRSRTPRARLVDQNWEIGRNGLKHPDLIRSLSQSLPMDKDQIGMWKRSPMTVPSLSTSLSSHVLLNNRDLLCLHREQPIGNEFGPKEKLWNVFSSW